MQSWNKIYGAMVFGAALAASVGVAGSASAQQATSATAAAAPAADSQRDAAAPTERKNGAGNHTLRARDLMTSAERETYRASMRSAADDQARAQIQSEWKNRLQQRATERGGVLADGHGDRSKIANGNGEKEAPAHQAPRLPPRGL